MASWGEDLRKAQLAGDHERAEALRQDLHEAFGRTVVTSDRVTGLAGSMRSAAATEAEAVAGLVTTLQNLDEVTHGNAASAEEAAAAAEELNAQAEVLRHHVDEFRQVVQCRNV